MSIDILEKFQPKDFALEEIEDIICALGQAHDMFSRIFRMRIYEFLSSPIACAACERTELLKTEITAFSSFSSFFPIFSPSKLFLVFEEVLARHTYGT